MAVIDGGIDYRHEDLTGNVGILQNYSESRGSMMMGMGISMIYMDGTLSMERIRSKRMIMGPMLPVLSGLRITMVSVFAVLPVDMAEIRDVWLLSCQLFGTDRWPGGFCFFPGNDQICCGCRCGYRSE